MTMINEEVFYCSQINSISGVFSIQVEPTGEVLLGSRVQFRCTVEANPLPERVFFDKLRDDGNFKREETLTLENGSNTAVLDRNIAWTDNGTWRCGVTHTVPADEKNFEITVLGKWLTCCIKLYCVLKMTTTLWGPAMCLKTHYDNFSDSVNSLRVAIDHLKFH